MTIHRDALVPAAAPRSSARSSALMLATILLATLAATPVRAGLDRDNDEAVLAIVEAWAAAADEKAVYQLVKFEAMAEGYRIERIAQAQDRLTKALSRIDANSLLSLAGLHRASFLVHTDEGRLEHAQHAISRMRSVLDRYSRRLKTPEAKSESARQWIALGMSLLARGGSHVKTAEACFRESFDHARANSDHPLVVEARRLALHARATALERRGQSPRALEDLEELLASDPDHTEARLRLGVNLARTGELELSIKTLREVAALEQPAWIVVVAAQELGSLLAEVGRKGEAIELLRDATKRFPKNTRLLIQLSHLTRSNWQESNRYLEMAMGGPHGTDGIRPRVRYEGPFDEFNLVRRAAVRDHKRRHPALGKALLALAAEAAESAGEPTT